VRLNEEGKTDFIFYEAQWNGPGSYFLLSLYADIHDEQTEPATSPFNTEPEAVATGK